MLSGNLHDGALIMQMKEVAVKRSVMLSILFVAALAFAGTGCRRSAPGQSTETVTTQTIAPAAAPSSPNGSDAMTQTVDVEDSRSEAEGGSLNNTQTASANVTPATAASPKAAKKPVRKK